MRIGILQCGHASAEVAAEHGDYAAMFEALLAGHGFTFTSWDVVDLRFPPDVHAADGWLLTGSKHGVYDGLPFIARLEAFVRAAWAARVPLVGICFGHQLIAQALGGRVEKYAGGWALGRQDYDIEGLGQVALNAWHQDQVMRPPPGARRFATSPFCRNAGLLYGPPGAERALSVQAHPEFSNEVIDALIRLRRGTATYPDELMDAAAGHLGRMPDSARLGGMIAQFFLAHAPERAQARAAPPRPAPAPRSGTHG